MLAYGYKNAEPIKFDGQREGYKEINIGYVIYYCRFKTKALGLCFIS